jgi:hypothetical protein
MDNKQDKHKQPGFTIRLASYLMEALKKRAKEERRTRSQMAVILIEDTLRRDGNLPGE